jgi:glycosyltransferase involved in cell wall biosynthesis
LFYELAEDLVSMGHTVTVITGIPKYNVPAEAAAKYKGRIFLKEMINQIQVLRTPVFPFPRRIPFLRGLEHFLIAIEYFFAGLVSKRHDAILVYSPPLTLGLTAKWLKRRWKSPFVFNVQDIYPQAMIDLGLLRNPLLIRISEGMERSIYRDAFAVTVHSAGNEKQLLSRVEAGKVRVISNWVDTEGIKPVHQNIRLRSEYKLGQYFVVSFAGIMGFAQGLESVVDCAEILQSYPEILFWLVGDGPLKSELERRVQQKGLTNVQFLPMQPREKYPDVLAASDVCLVTLAKQVSTPVVPAKLLSIMSSGRPVIASVPLDGDTAQIVRDSGSGICVEAGNERQLAEAILKLYHTPELAQFMGRSGREYAMAHFSRQVCTKQYESLLLEAVGAHR